MRLTFKLILMIGIYFLCVRLLYADSISIQMKEDVRLNGTAICLGDIAVVQGEDTVLVRALKEIPIAQVPQLETGKRSISTSEVLMHMRKIGIEESRIKFSGPSVATVYPELQTIPAQHVFDIVTGFIYENMPWDPNDVIMHPQRMPDDMAVVCGDVSYEVIPLSKNQYIGQSRYTVIIYVDGQIQKSVNIFLDIVVFKEILVASKKIERGEMILPSNVMRLRKELRANTQDAISDPARVLGMIAARSIPANGILKSSYIEMPVIVQRKDMVRVYLKSGGLLIQSVGLARESGVIGDYIKVQNIDSQKIFFAQVTGIREVTVDANAGEAL